MKSKKKASSKATRGQGQKDFLVAVRGFGVWAFATRYDRRSFIRKIQAMRPASQFATSETRSKAKG